jgi:hypothetical protein
MLNEKYGGPGQPPPRRRFQFRLRTLLIGVTLAALVCWGWVLYRRAGEFRDRAHALEDQVELNRQWLVAPRAGWVTPPPGSPIAGWTEQEVSQIRTKKLIYYARLAEKYAFLADHPWLSRDTDPPAPDWDKRNLEPPPSQSPSTQP